ncbi:MAG: hypothetical protein R3F56_10375 [Planctomycetota bacterium]
MSSRLHASWIGVALAALSSRAQLPMGDLRTGNEIFRILDVAAIGAYGNQVLISTSNEWDGERTWITDTSPGSLRALSEFLTAPSANVRGELYAWRGGPGGVVRGRPPAWVFSPAFSIPRPAAMLAVGDHICFSVVENEFYSKLLVSDGTQAGTRILRDNIRSVVGTWHERLLFSFLDEGYLTRLGITDGTPAGTRNVRLAEPVANVILLDGPRILVSEWSVPWPGRVRLVDPATGGGEVVLDPAGGGMSLVGAVALGDSILFGTRRAPPGDELWRYELATRSAHLVRSGVGTSASFVAALGVAYFSVFDGPDPGLWRSDGTAAGTWLLHRSALTNGRPIEVASFADDVVFAADDALWSSDGTSVRLLHASRYGPMHLLHRGAQVALFASNDGMAAQVVRTDTTPAGTFVLAEFSARAPRGALQSDTTLHAIDERVVFRATDDTGDALFASDGTPGSVVVLARDVQETAQVGDDVLFVRRQRELSCTDGTPVGVRRLFDAGAEGVAHLTPWRDRLAFLVTGPGTARLGVTDGTVAGTWVGQTTLSASALAAADRQLFVVAGAARELWRSDGTDAGTRLVATLPTPIARSSLVTLGDRLQFCVDGRLWVSDGTPDGTTPYTGPPWPAADARAELDGDVYFVQTNALWRLSADGDRVVKVLGGSGNGGYGWRRIVALDGHLLFALGDTKHGDELWISDGTAHGTHLLDDLHPGSAHSRPEHMYAMPELGLAFFSADDGSRGRELWCTDGTAAGTRAVCDLARPGDSVPAAATLAGAHVFFSARTRAQGRELWALPLTDLEVAVRVRFASGCAAAAAPTLGASARPRLGTAPQLLLADAPVHAPAVVCLSWHRTHLPLGTCQLLVGPELGLLPTRTDGAGAAALPLVLPGATSLIGLHIFAQGAVFAPGEAPVTSDGLHLIVGSR